MTEQEKIIESLQRLRALHINDTCNGYRLSVALTEAIQALEQQNKHRWIPVEEALPEDTEKSGYIMLSFENFDLPDIGRYEVDEDGGGTFYPGDNERSCQSCGLFINAWMPLPAPYRSE